MCRAGTGARISNNNKNKSDNDNDSKNNNKDNSRSHPPSSVSNHREPSDAKMSSSSSSPSLPLRSVVAVSPSGTLAAVLTRNGAVRCHALPSCELVFSTRRDSPSSSSSVEIRCPPTVLFCGDSRLAVVGSSSIALYDVAACRWIAFVAVPSDAVVHDVASVGAALSLLLRDRRDGRWCAAEHDAATGSPTRRVRAGRGDVDDDARGLLAADEDATYAATGDGVRALGRFDGRRLAKRTNVGRPTTRLRTIGRADDDGGGALLAVVSGEGRRRRATLWTTKSADAGPSPLALAGSLTVDGTVESVDGTTVRGRTYAIVRLTDGTISLHRPSLDGASSTWPAATTLRFPVAADEIASTVTMRDRDAIVVRAFADGTIRTHRRAVWDAQGELLPRPSLEPKEETESERRQVASKDATPRSEEPTVAFASRKRSSTTSKPVKGLSGGVERRLFPTEEEEESDEPTRKRSKRRTNDDVATVSETKSEEEPFDEDEEWLSVIKNADDVPSVTKALSASFAPTTKKGCTDAKTNGHHHRRSSSPPLPSIASPPKGEDEDEETKKKGDDGDDSLDRRARRLADDLVVSLRRNRRDKVDALLDADLAVVSGAAPAIADAGSAAAVLDVVVNKLDDPRRVFWTKRLLVETIGRRGADADAVLERAERLARDARGAASELSQLEGRLRLFERANRETDDKEKRGDGDQTEDA